MSPRPQANFRLDQDILDGLKAVYETDGILPSEQVRRAVRGWLEARGVLAPPASKTKTARKRVGARKQA